MDALASPPRMTREEYRRWSEGQPGRYELVRGEVLRRPRQRAFQALTKMRVWRLFGREIEARGLSCQALPDGMAVEIGQDTDFEPMVMINCGQRVADDDVVAPNPVVVVDVAWPGASVPGTRVKAANYFLAPSVQHYLIISPDPDRVIHPRRGESGAVFNEGTIRLDPSGIDVDVAEIFADT